MKNTYALTESVKAITFGFKAFFKNPLFFLISFIVTKIIWTVGLGLSFLISLPYFIHLIEFVLKLFARVKDIIFNYVLGSFLGGTVESIFENFGFSLFTRINAFGFVKEVAEQASQGQMLEKVAGETIVGNLAKGAAQIVGVGEKISEALGELKEILRQIIQSKFLFLFFLIGIIILLIGIKMTYDFLMLGWVNMSLNFYDKKSGSLKDLFCAPQLWMKYMLATVLFLAIILLPTLIYFWFYLLITYFVAIPTVVSYIAYGITGIITVYLALRLWLYPYYIIDEQIGAVKALQKSYDLGLGFISIIISLCVFTLILGIPFGLFYIYPNSFTLSILALFLVITWISSWMSYACLYRKLRV